MPFCLPGSIDNIDIQRVYRVVVDIVRVCAACPRLQAAVLHVEADGDGDKLRTRPAARRVVCRTGNEAEERKQAERLPQKVLFIYHAVPPLLST